MPSSIRTDVTAVQFPLPTFEEKSEMKGKFRRTTLAFAVLTSLSAGLALGQDQSAAPSTPPAAAAAQDEAPAAPAETAATAPAETTATAPTKTRAAVPGEAMPPDAAAKAVLAEEPAAPAETAAAPAAAPAAKATPAPVMEQGALDLVKKMSAKLAATPAFLVRTRSALEAPGGTGQFLTFFTESVIAVKRPNQLSAEIRGDAPPFDFYYNGSKMTAYEPTRKLYATTDAPKTLDELLPFAAKTAGILLPFEDVLYSDPYAALTQNLTSAFYAGYSVIGGVRCEHVALATPEIAGEIWIDAKTDLPCRVAGILLHVQDAPRFSVEYYDWKLKPKLPERLFTFTPPAGAKAIDFGAVTGAGH